MMPPSTATPFWPGPPRNLLWTVDQFHYLGDLGMFEGRRAMLIDGVIVEEGPMDPPHAMALLVATERLRAVFTPGWVTRVQLPLVLGQSTDPEPDLAFVPGRPQDYPSHPTTAGLVVEVSDSSVKFDTTRKMSLYAAGGVADYWVLDVNARRLLVFRDPKPDPAQPHGHGYAAQLTLGPADTIAPLAAPNGVVMVADLLP